MPPAPNYHEQATATFDSPIVNPTSERKLQYVLIEFLNVAPANVSTNRTWLTLQEQGIIDFDCFQSLSEDDIMNLSYWDAARNADWPLAMIIRRRLAMLRMYHLWVIHHTRWDVQIDELVLAGFDVYRVVFYEDHVNAVKRGSKGEGNAYQGYG